MNSELWLMKYHLPFWLFLCDFFVVVKYDVCKIVIYYLKKTKKIQFLSFFKNKSRYCVKLTLCTRGTLRFFHSFSEIWFLCWVNVKHGSLENNNCIKIISTLSGKKIGKFVKFHFFWLLQLMVFIFKID